MRIIAWNIGHSTYEKRGKKHVRIPKELPAALLSFKSDVIVLNEYVERPAPKGHDYLEEALRTEFPYTQMSDKQPSKHGHNRVFIASRTQLQVRDLLADEHRALHVGKRNLHVHAASNYLHVYLSEYDLSVIGLRVPDPKGEEIDAYWGWFKLEVNKLMDRRIILIGDFNANPRGSKSKDKHLKCLIAGGWRWENPTGEDWSYISQKNNGTKSRIDHVLSSHVEIQSAEYIIQRGPYNFMERDWSDHAVLSVSVNCPRVNKESIP